MSNAYGRCGTLTDGRLPISAYSGGKYSPWPTNGVVDAGTYDVSVNLDCAATPVTCPRLTVNDGCSIVISTMNSAVSVPNGDCFDVNYTATGNEGANGIYVTCSTNKALGNNCMRQLKYTSQTGMNTNSCSETNNRTNTTFYFNINDSSRPTAGKKFELEGIVPGIYTMDPSDIVYECVANWPAGAVWTQECQSTTNGSTIISIKPNAQLTPFSGDAGIECKIKTDNGNNW